MSVQLLHGDCLDLLPTLPAQSVDLVLSDWPYGTTACAWDSVIPLDKLWPELKRVLKPRGAVVLTASQPFTTTLIMSNRAWFRYELIWDKVNRYTNYANANKMPMKRHENIVVFYARLPTFNKQYRAGQPYQSTVTSNHGKHLGRTGLTNRLRVNDGNHNPCSIIPIKAKTPEQGLHPTQKPLALFEYLMRTYSNPDDVILDNAFGSCTTGEAAIRLQRAFIGMERDADYFAIGAARCAAAQAAPVQAALLEVGRARCPP
jgi:site-specific DNA-methyltransferase (adenine-specific)